MFYFNYSAQRKIETTNQLQGWIFSLKFLLNTNSTRQNNSCDPGESLEPVTRYPMIPRSQINKYSLKTLNSACFLRVSIVEAGLSNLLKTSRAVVQLVTMFVKSQTFFLVSEKDSSLTPTVLLWLAIGPLLDMSGRFVSWQNLLTWSQLVNNLGIR